MEWLVDGVAVKLRDRNWLYADNFLSDGEKMITGCTRDKPDYSQQEIAGSCGEFISYLYGLDDCASNIISEG